MTQQAVLELPLDDDLLKVLASDTRREMLRLLTERRMTGSELATRLDLGKPAVAEHLKKLQDAGLIVRHDDEERRWVYYELSPRGLSLLQPSKVRFYFVLGVGVAALLLGIAIALTLVPFLQGPAASPAPLDTTGDEQGQVAYSFNEILALGAPPLPEAVLPDGVPPLPESDQFQPATQTVVDGNGTGNDPVPATTNATSNLTAEPVELVWVVPENVTLPAAAQPAGFYFSRDDVDVENGTVTIQVLYQVGNETILTPVTLVPVLPGNLTLAQAIAEAQAAAANATAQPEGNATGNATAPLPHATVYDEDGNGILDWIEPWLAATPAKAPAELAPVAPAPRPGV